MSGIYKVDVFINQVSVGLRDLNFVPADTEEKRAGITDSTGLMPELTRSDLINMGVRPEAFGNASREEKVNTLPLSLGSVIPQAATRFDFQQMRLYISIPQKWMNKQPRNWIPPERWDDGITAGMLNWSVSGTDSHGRYGSYQSHFLRLNSGINAGSWRLRDEHSMSDSSNGTSHSREWRHERTWLERGIPAWHSTFLPVTPRRTPIFLIRSGFAAPA